MPPERKVPPKKESQSRWDRWKEKARNNWKPFAVGAGVTTVTIVTVIVAKRVLFPNRTALMIKKMIVKDSVFLIQSFEHRQGPPSWMVRSGDLLWRSQKAAAKAAGVSQSTMSRHLRGVRPHINGRVYERVAVEVGRKV